MLYYKFQNYEEFKETFGLNYHSNGTKSRKNKILLSFIKNKEYVSKDKYEQYYTEEVVNTLGNIINLAVSSDLVQLKLLEVS